jgi:hypothetical protein
VNNFSAIGPVASDRPQTVQIQPNDHLAANAFGTSRFNNHPHDNLHN